MTRTGNDHLKRRARDLARATGRRYPDVLAELRRGPVSAPSRVPSKELVRVCNEPLHPFDFVNCAQPAGHDRYDGVPWSSCNEDPHYPVHVWHGYHQVYGDAARAEHDAWWNSLTPEQQEEEEAHYWADLAADSQW